MNLSHYVGVPFNVQMKKKRKREEKVSHIILKMASMRESEIESEENPNSKKWIGFWIAAGSLVFSTSVIIINKSIMGTGGFRYPISLTFFHFASTFICTCIGVFFGLFQPCVRTIPFKEMMKITSIAVSGVIFTNYSLQYNSVGTYQVICYFVISFKMKLTRKEKKKIHSTYANFIIQHSFFYNY